MQAYLYLLLFAATFLTGCCKDDSSISFIKYSQETRYALMQRPKGSYWVYKDFEHNVIDTFTVDNLVYEFTQSKDKHQCGSYMINNWESSNVKIKNSDITNTNTFHIVFSAESIEFTQIGSNMGWAGSSSINISEHYDYTELNGKTFSNSIKIKFTEPKLSFKTIIIQPPLGIIAFQDSLDNYYELIDHKF